MPKRLRCLLAAAGFLVATAACADEAPVRILVGFPAGGGSDMIARLVAERIKIELGVPVVIDNRPGANGLIAAEALKNAAPDGRTLMVSPIAVTVFAPLTNAALRYEPARDFAPVSLAARYDLALAVSASVPARTVAEYLDWVRADPARAVYGTPTVGGPPHFFGVMLAKSTGIDLRPVAYKGGPPMVTDLVGGQIPAAITSLADFMPQREAGRLRVLATSGAQRSAVAPDVPTFRELGFAEIEGTGWQAFHTTAGTPRPMIDRLSRAIAAALQSAEVREKLLAVGLEPVGSTPEALARRAAEDIARWTPIVKASGYKPEP